MCPAESDAPRPPAGPSPSPQDSAEAPEPRRQDATSLAHPRPGGATDDTRLDDGRDLRSTRVAPVRTGGAAPLDDSADVAPAGHRPLLWLPIVIFVALLVTAGVVGRFVVPTSAPARAAATPVVTKGPPGTLPPSPLPSVPTAPDRPAEALASWATQVSGATSIPVVAVEAYGYAQLLLQRDSPQCHLSWTTLAGIGAVESQHGTAGGAQLGSNGRSTPPVQGPLLDGKGGRALVRDTDAGAYDGDSSFDRAMGPLHLMPSMWASYSSDGDNDSIADPYDIDDASVALARLLCAAGKDLAALPGWQAAVATFHAGTAYQKSVFTAADSYGQRTRSIG